MKAANLERAVANPNENWMAAKLGVGWTRQAVRGYRIFDFWHHGLGCAVEVDGPEHDRAYDNYRDEYVFRRSGVIVLRVRNKCEEDAKTVIATIRRLDTHKDRRAKLGILGGKKQKRHMSSQPYSHSELMFVEFLREQYNHTPYWMT